MGPERTLPSKTLSNQRSGMVSWDQCGQGDLDIPPTLSETKTAPSFWCGHVYMMCVCRRTCAKVWYAGQRTTPCVSPCLWPFWRQGVFVVHSFMRQSSWPIWGFSCLWFLIYCRSTGTVDAHYLTRLYLGSVGFNSGPHAWTLIHSPTKETSCHVN